MRIRPKCSKCDNPHFGRGLCRKHYRQLKDVKEKENKYDKKYYSKNRGKYKKWWAKYYPNNRESILKQRKKYNKEHPEIGLKSKIKQLKKLGLVFKIDNKQYIIALNLWSKTIKKRDNYTCKKCDSKENLNTHHIKPKSKYPELSLDLDNGITLCEDCHGKKHGFKIYQGKH